MQIFAEHVCSSGLLQTATLANSDVKKKQELKGSQGNLCKHLGLALPTAWPRAPLSWAEGLQQSTCCETLSVLRPCAPSKGGQTSFARRLMSFHVERGFKKSIHTVSYAQQTYNGGFSGPGSFHDAPISKHAKLAFARRILGELHCVTSLKWGTSM